MPGTTDYSLNSRAEIMTKYFLLMVNKFISLLLQSILSKQHVVSAPVLKEQNILLGELVVTSYFYHSHTRDYTSLQACWFVSLSAR